MYLPVAWNQAGAPIERKLQEQYLAVQLEKNSGMTKKKQKIITNYLNTINLGKQYPWR